MMAFINKLVVGWKKGSGEHPNRKCSSASHCKTLKFCHGLPVIGSAGLSLLQKSAAKV
jgi:hypothetical protein